MKLIGSLLTLLGIVAMTLCAAQGNDPNEAKGKEDRWILLGRTWEFTKVANTFKVISARYDPQRNESVWVLENRKDDLGVLNSIRSTPFKVVFLDAEKTAVGTEGKVQITKIGTKSGERFRLTVTMPEANAFKEVKTVQVLSLTSLVN